MNYRAIFSLLKQRATEEKKDLTKKEVMNAFKKHHQQKFEKKSIRKASILPITAFGLNIKTISIAASVVLCVSLLRDNGWLQIDQPQQLHQPLSDSFQENLDSNYMLLDSANEASVIL